MIQRSLCLENYSKQYQKFNIIVYTIGKKQFIIYICKS